VLQALQRVGWLRGRDRANFLAGVSGGAYIAAAVTLAALGPREGEQTFAEGPERRVVAPADPFSRGSPEESYLRSHLLYLREAPGGVAGTVLRVILGVTFNLAVVSLVLALSGVPLGWIYGFFFEALQAGRGRCLNLDACPVDLDVGVPLIVALSFGGAAIFAGWSVVALRFTHEAARRWVYGTAIACLSLGAAVLLVGVGIPKAVEFVRDAAADQARTPSPVGSGSFAGLLATAGGSLAGLVITMLVALRDPPGKQDGVATRWAGMVRPVISRLRIPVLNLATAILGPLLLSVLFVVFVNVGAYRSPLGGGGDWAGDVLVYLALGATAALLWRRGDLVAWSLHPIYKRRLARAFAARRFSSAGGTEGAEEIPYDRLPPLSESQPGDFPELLICAAANVSDHGKTPAGTNVTSFVFSADKVGGGLTGEWETRHLERLLNRGRRRDLTLMTAVAVSGAAVAPSMGKMTRRPLRFLFALANVRLGVWLPNPLRASWFDRLRPDRTVFARPDYFLRELLGRNRLSARFLYVSDGGHYENLGLVELLRRGCREVWCVDASGDKENTFSTLGQAIAIARAEHLIDDIVITPLSMAPDPAVDPDIVRATHTTGTIIYPDGTTGRLVLLKAGVPVDAPWDVRAFERRWPAFPCDPTTNQIYTAERFEAYRQLGYFAACRALHDVLGADVPPAVDLRDAPPGSTSKVEAMPVPKLKET
jgi:hypothetical protein